MRKDKGIKIRWIRTMVIVLTASVVICVASVGASAYWTDGIEGDSIVSALNLSIAYADPGVEIEEGDSLLPGDERDMSFIVENTGEISADVRPVISIGSESDMSIGGSEYLLLDRSGQRLMDYDVEYYHGEELVEPLEGNVYDKAVYTKKTGNTLFGSRHRDEEQDMDTESGGLINEKEYSFVIRLSENSGNDFMDASARIEVDTIAVQHRFSDGIINGALEDLRASGSDAP